MRRQLHLAHDRVDVLARVMRATVSVCTYSTAPCSRASDGVDQLGASIGRWRR
jgi:hypothetical protein